MRRTLPTTAALVVLTAVTLLPSASAEVVWSAPEGAFSGHPVHAAWADVASRDPLALSGHAEVPVRILLDDVLLFESRSVHEHDGFHPLIVTPPRPGVLRLEASPEGGTPVVQEIRVEAGTAAGAAPRSDFENLTAPAVPRAGGTEVGLEGYHGLEAQPWGFDVQHDVRDAQGRLLLSGRGGVSTVLPFLGDAVPAWAVRTTATARSAPGTDGGETVGLRSLDTPVGHAPQEDMAVRAMLPAAADCPSPPVLDPPSILAEGLAWGPWTDVRVAFPEGSPGSLASLEERGPLGGATLWRRGLDDPWGSVTFRAPGPGSYRLVLDGATPCALPFEVTAAGSPLPGVPGLPADPVAPGTVEAAIGMDGADPGRVGITLTPKGPDGALLPHYEFDLRIVRPGDARGEGGLLVWQGKLHGHDGRAALTLGGLEAGTYRVEAYPSPQDADGVPVATDDPGGFVWAFEVSAGAEAQRAENAVPSAVALPAVLVAWALIRRR